MMTIFISAGELSGDAHGARLCEALLTQDPSLKIVGFGGPKMKAAGVDIIHDMTHTSIIGIVEALFFIPSYFSALKLIVTSIKKIKPDIFIPIDNQGFHMMVLNKIKEEPCKKIYYIAPQEWQWGTESGGKKVVMLVDHILSIFPKEEHFYKKLGASVDFIGHPIVDLTDVKLNTEKETIVTVFPGSRLQEIKRVGPILIEAASLFLEKHPEFKLIVSISDERYRSQLESMISDFSIPNVVFSSEPSSVLINQSICSFSTSGTITFEHACLETPCVVAYKFHPVTYFLARTIFRKMTNKITYMTLPNILLNKELFPEFLQGKATPKDLAEKVESIIMNKLHYETIKKECKILREELGGTGVVDRAAKIILSLL
jgi:lipid-A-disaccharide synthase